MSEKRFNIVFRGEIVGGADEAAVKANVGKLFKANEKVLARLFSGEPIAIKKDVDKAGAMKYRALMKKAGAICYAVDPSAPLDATPVAKPAPVPAPATAATPAPQAPVPPASPPTTPASGADDDWSLAPAGSDLEELRNMETVEIPDISDMSMAEVGVDLVENPEPIAQVAIPDISDIDLAPVGADVADPKEEVKAEIPDTGGIDLAPVGSDVADPVEKDEPEPPDVSSIDLAPVGSDVADPEPEKEAPKVDISHIQLENS